MSDSTAGFDVCEICGADRWCVVYSGAIRDGAFGSQRMDAKIAKCSGCGVYRLAETYCLGEEAYETSEYREHLTQGIDLNAYFKAHDGMQIFALEAIHPWPLRGMTVVDVGCGGGSFLDHVRGVVERAIAIEPEAHYRAMLKDRGYDAYPYVQDATQALGSNFADMVVSFQVIEHVSDPRRFLADIRRIVKPNGVVVLSTPNRDDILMSLLPNDFPAFFYRVAHRWYFDAKALVECAERAGFAVKEIRYLHRYGMANMLHWLRDRKPQGLDHMSGISEVADGFWKSYLESTGQADNLFVSLVPKN